MKTKEYVSKYNLDKGVNFNHNGFISDLTFDFITLLEVGNSTKNIKGYENAVRAIRMKWDAISNKTAGVLPDKLWNYFYASVIAKTRNELFPDVMAQRKKDAEERDKRRREYEDFERREFGGFGFGSGFFWDFLLASMIKDNKPIESFKVLGLDSEASTDDVKNAYRQLSMQHHPDKGGNSDKFIEITEAKNKCLAYLS
jgi:hypothetical protein